MSEHQINNSILVAVPYYGSLTLPPLGLSRLFFVAFVDTGSNKVERMEIQVWDPWKDLNLSAWMRKQGFSGVICSDSGSHYQVALNAENIWLMGNQEGEAAELVERWAAGTLVESSSSRLGEKFKSWCGLQQECAVLAV
jgi:predicted Fe-Mo cluster-binding NifX family protein